MGAICRLIFIVFTASSRIDFPPWSDTVIVPSIMTVDLSPSAPGPVLGRPATTRTRVPTAVLEHLGTWVPKSGGVPPDLATLRAFYSDAPRVLYRHQQI